MSAAAKKPSEALRKAQKLITPEEAWTRGSSARDFRGRPVSPRSQNAKCWCVMGALEVYADSSLAYHCRDIFRNVVGSSILEFNDDPDRTHAEVLSAFDRAASLAESEGQ